MHTGWSEYRADGTGIPTEEEAETLDAWLRQRGKRKGEEMEL
jgi:hypothetical protein